MTECEVCGKPATVVCAGLDVPMLAFCARHGAEHARECDDYLHGRAHVHDRRTGVTYWARPVPKAG